MKQLVFITSLLLALVFGVKAQQAVPTLEAALSEFSKAHSLSELQQTANRFERLSLSNQSAWLPAYYTSLVNTIMTYSVKEPTQKDALLDKADEFFQKAIKLQPANEEMEVLRANIANARITVDPEKRWSKYGDIVDAALQKAEKLNPANPRVTLLRAQGTFYTPKTYGGGPTKALPIVQKALEQFGSFKPASPLYPSWGESQAKELLTACQKAAKSAAQ